PTPDPDLCPLSLHDALPISTKEDSGWLSRLPGKDVAVGYPGPSLCVQGHLHPGPVARKDRVILVVSTLEERKNAPFVLDWFLNTDRKSTRLNSSHGSISYAV